MHKRLNQTDQHEFQSPQINNEPIQQHNEQQNQCKQISNRQKISKLHERIKMLDKLNYNNNSMGNQNKMNKEFQSINKRLQIQVDRDEDQNDHDNNFYQARNGQNTFSNKAFTPKAFELQNNHKNVFNVNKFTSQSPTANAGNLNSNLNGFSNNRNLNNLSRSNLMNNNNSLNNSQASRSPNTYISPKHNNQNHNQSQNQSLYNINNSSSLRPSNLSQFYPVESKYLSIQDKFLKFKFSQQNLMKNVELQINELQQNIKHMKKDYEKLEKRNQETLDNAEKSLNAEIQELYDELKQLKKGAVESIDTKYKAIKTETIAMITQQFQNQCKKSSQQITLQLQTAYKILQKQQILRDQTTQFLINSFGDQIIKLEEILNRERQLRIQKNDQMLKIINNVENQMLERLNKEKREMGESVEAMENMLEEVCYKIEEKILGN